MMKEAEILQEGKILIYPTDTIWGIGCDALNVSAIERIKEIKGRDKSKSFIVLVKDIQMLQEYVEHLHQKAIDLIEENEKKHIPTTILYKDIKLLPLENLSSNDYLGIRIAKTDFLQRLFCAYPYPIVSSSANFSGSPSPRNFSEIDKDFLAKADYVSLEQREETHKSNPSSIFIIKDNNNIEQIR